MTTITLPTGQVITGTNATIQAWNVFLAMLQTWETAETQVVQFKESDFSLDGELRDVGAVGYYRTLTPSQETRANENADMNAWFTRGEGMTDTTISTDDTDELVDELVGDVRSYSAKIGRWEHLKDSHREEQAEIERMEAMPVMGINPLFTAMSQAAKEREAKFQKAMAWIEQAGLAELLKRRGGYAKKQRNEALAQALGFNGIPKGKWPGVEWNGKLNAMVRKNGNVTRVATLWDIPWTKDQATTLDAAIEGKVAEKLGK